MVIDPHIRFIQPHQVKLANSSKSGEMALALFAVLGLVVCARADIVAFDNPIDSSTRHIHKHTDTLNAHTSTASTAPYISFSGVSFLHDSWPIAHQQCGAQTAPRTCRILSCQRMKAVLRRTCPL